MLRLVSVLVFVLGNADCASLKSDTKRLTSVYDSKASPNVLPQDIQESKNQAISSSYSNFDSSAGSSGPSQSTYPKSTEFDPDGQNSENLPIGSHASDRPLKSQFADESSSREYVYDEGYESDATTQKSPARLRPKESRHHKITQAPKISPTASPKGTSEVVEKSVPLEEAGSAKSGKFLDGEGLGEDYEGSHSREKHFDKEQAKKFAEAHKKEGGEEAHKAYKKQEAYDKAEKEDHGKAEKKAALSEKEAQKKEHHDEEKHLGKQYTGQEGEKGIIIKKKDGHQKGHKKNGFQKVHKKNEYKVDEEFFENSHDGDEHEEHLDEREKHAKEKDEAAKKGSLDSSYHEGHDEKKVLENKNAHHDQAAGHKKEAGEQEHHDQHSEYGKKGGHKEGNKYGHAEGGGHSEGGYFEGGGF